MPLAVWRALSEFLAKTCPISGRVPAHSCARLLRVPCSAFRLAVRIGRKCDRGMVRHRHLRDALRHRPGRETCFCSRLNDVIGKGRLAVMTAAHPEVCPRMTPSSLTEETIFPYRTAPARMVTARSYLIDRYVPDCEIIALPEKEVAGGGRSGDPVS